MSTRLKRRVLDKTAAYTIVSVTDAAGTIFTNRGAGGSVTITLPAPNAATKGDWYEFRVHANQSLIVASPTAGQIVAPGNAAANNVGFETASAKVGRGLIAECDGTSWHCYPIGTVDGFNVNGADVSQLIGGAAVTATAAELNAVADISAQAAIAANGDTLAVTADLHAGRIVQFGKTTGTIVTLPAATGTGHIFRFVIGITATSNANIIKVANATDVMDGSINVQQDTDADGTTKVWRADAGDDTMTFAGAAGTGGIVGGYIECVDYKAGFWSCRAFTQSGGGAEVTPFSATVA
jgi:hypothetical protein